MFTKNGKDARHFGYIFAFALVILFFTACSDANEPNPSAVFRKAEANTAKLNSFTVNQVFTISFDNFPEQTSQMTCSITRPDKVNCIADRELIRIGNQFWERFPGSVWREPPESLVDRLDVVIRYFEITLPPGLLRFEDEGIPGFKIADIIDEYEFVGETIIDGTSVYEITFSIDDSYHDLLDYRGEQTASISGEMRKAGDNLNGSGSGSVWIGKENQLIRRIIINSNFQVDESEGTTMLQIDYENMNDPISIPDPRQQ